MSDLTVTLNYSSTDYTPAGVAQQTPVALPLKVVDADGVVLADGVAISSEPSSITLPDFEGPPFVRLTWPSGRVQTRRAVPGAASTWTAHFDDSRISHNEWSAWAVLRLGEKSTFAEPSSENDLDIQKFDKVWLRLWKYDEGRWMPAPFAPTQAFHNRAVVQMEFQLGAACWLLQLGAARVPWHFVALPGGGPCRVLITPSESTDPRREPLKVVVTSYRRDAETLLEFLARDSLRAATSLATTGPLATRLLEEKSDDPISAIIGAYFLLRTDGWRSVPTHWFDNLFHMFPWIPDPAIIRCVIALRSGVSVGTGGVERAVADLETAWRRGLPVFAEGITLLQEAASVLRASERAPKHEVFESIERLAASEAWAGAMLSFRGARPTIPSPEKQLGSLERAMDASLRFAENQELSTMGSAVDGFTLLGDVVPNFWAKARSSSPASVPGEKTVNYERGPATRGDVEAYLQKLWEDLLRPNSEARRQVDQAGIDINRLPQRLEDAIRVEDAVGSVDIPGTAVVFLAAAPIVKKVVLDLWKFVALPQIRRRWGDSALRERKPPKTRKARSR